MQSKQMTKEDREKIWEAIVLLKNLGKKDLAFQLRVIYDTYYRDPNGHWKRR